MTIPEIDSNSQNANESILLYMDYGKTLMLDAYRKCCAVPDRYPLYFERECNISNPWLLHKQLIDEWYLFPSTSEEILSSMTVAELKSILTSCGLKTNGKKAVLVERILNSLDAIDLDEFLYNTEKTYYSLSPKGQEFLEKHYDYILLHKNANWMISIDRYVAAKHKLNSNDFYEVCLHILNSAIKAGDLVDKSLRHLDLSELYEQVGELDQVLYHRLINLFYRLNFVNLYEYCKRQENFYSNYELKEQCVCSLKNTYCITLSDASQIVKLQGEFSNDMIDRIFSENPIPIPIITSREFKMIISDMFTSTSFNWTNWDAILKSLFKQRFILK